MVAEAAPAQPGTVPSQPVTGSSVSGAQPGLASPTRAARTVPDAVWVEPGAVAHWAGGAESGSSPAPSPGLPTAAPAAVESVTPPTTAPAEPERLTLTREDYERDVEGRIQKALTAARRRWDAERREQDEARTEQARTEARERERQERAELARRAAAGDEDAREELSRMAISLFGAEALEAQRAQAVAEAERAARERIWRQHAQSFGLDPEDADVTAAVAGAADFKALNRALAKLAKDEEVLSEFRANPALVTWRDAEVAAAVAEAEKRAAEKAEAAFLNGQATVVGQARGPDLSAGGTGRPATPEEIERAFMNAPDDPEAIDAYRKLRRLRGWK